MARRVAGPPERRTAVVGYAELRNFTRMSEMLDAPRVLELASRFFELAARAVAGHEGEVIAVHNDSLLAAFHGGEPARIAAGALDAAQALQREFGELAERWQSEFGLAAAVAVGLHLGETVFGDAGPPGEEAYVAFGDTVSVAERLVHRARAGETVFSGAVMKALGAPAAAKLGPIRLPPLELARRPPIPIFGLLLDTRLDFT